MGNTSAIDKIYDATEKEELKLVIKNIHTTQNAIELKQKELNDKINSIEKENINQLEKDIIVYIQCLHMGSLRRFVNSNNCDKAISSLVSQTFYMIKKMDMYETNNKLKKEITKLSGREEL